MGLQGFGLGQSGGPLKSLRSPVYDPFQSSHQSAVKAPWLPLNTLVSPPSCTWQWLAVERELPTQQCDVTPYIYCQQRSALVVSPQHPVTLSSHSYSTQCPETRVTQPPPASA